MQKVGTAYTMYFNISRERTGSLFSGPFRSKHVGDDRYLKRVAQYIHFNPIEIFEPKWKLGKATALSNLEEKLSDYPFSSFPDFEEKGERIEKRILDTDSIELLRADQFPIGESLSEMSEYYASLN
jgi:hypothetical protein